MSTPYYTHHLGHPPRDKNVYFYNSSGVVCTERLKVFNRDQ
jgi:hypothetical protein